MAFEFQENLRFDLVWRSAKGGVLNGLGIAFARFGVWRLSLACCELANAGHNVLLTEIWYFLAVCTDLDTSLSAR